MSTLSNLTKSPLASKTVLSAAVAMAPFAMALFRRRMPTVSETTAALGAAGAIYGRIVATKKIAA